MFRVGYQKGLISKFQINMCNVLLDVLSVVMLAALLAFTIECNGRIPFSLFIYLTLDDVNIIH